MLIAGAGAASAGAMTGAGAFSFPGDYNSYEHWCGDLPGAAEKRHLAAYKEKAKAEAASKALKKEYPLATLTAQMSEDQRKVFYIAEPIHPGIKYYQDTAMTLKEARAAMLAGKEIWTPMFLDAEKLCTSLVGPYGFYPEDHKNEPWDVRHYHFKPGYWSDEKPHIFYDRKGHIVALPSYL